jgi:enamine deaminase RidA (YjgF/YER057c/UK114 family)
MAKMSEAHFYNEPVEKQMGFAAAIHSGKTIYISGIISVDMMLNIVAPGDMAGQINQIYDQMEAILKRNNATFESVVNEMIFVTDMQALTGAMAARAARYKDCGPPACTAVQVAGLFIPGAMIEIQATAVID